MSKYAVDPNPRHPYQVLAPDGRVLATPEELAKEASTVLGQQVRVKITPWGLRTFEAKRGRRWKMVCSSWFDLVRAMNKGPSREYDKELWSDG